MSTYDHAVVADGLVKTYPTGRGRDPVRALDGLSLCIEPGEVYGLLGPNGAGKSTTVKVLSTLSRADEGSAVVAGHDVRRDPQDVRRAIGLVPQRTSSAPLMTGRESIELAARMYGQSRSEAARRASELLDRFDLADAADRLTKSYSGGMARKLDVAVGLVNRPTVLFLDEPTTGLDPEARSDMWAEIARLSAHEQTAVLLTTHYLEECDRLADRLAIVDHGRIVVDGTPNQLKSELRGDGLVVDLRDVAQGPEAAALAAAIDDLHDVQLAGRELRARADEGARAIVAVLGRLEDAGVGVSSATVTRPSLDDVYLRHVGHSLAAVAA